jgi:hypothetical protein
MEKARMRVRERERLDCALLPKKQLQLRSKLELLIFAYPMKRGD